VFKNQSVNEICLFLPEDGVLAKQNLLNLLKDPSITEVYIKAFGFNMESLLSSILKLDRKGVHVYILADYMQARSPGSWDKLIEFHKNLKCGQLILTTAGIGSDQPSLIFHTKALTIIRKNKSAINWCGSCNFSDSGFSQANNIRIFESEVWSNEFIKHFNIHRNWALNKAAHKQIDYILANPVSAQDLEVNEEISEYIYQINKLKSSLKFYKIGFFITSVLLLFAHYFVH
jgi:hypothetical protein